MGWFANRIIDWQRREGRHDLPWQRTRDAYRIWVSEIMLQQTQVATVVPYYLRFVERFPDVASLADAPLDEVMRHWSGLGYYSRARNLHACARRVAGERRGEFPRSADELASLPGIGRSTAAAIAVFAFGQRSAILDGNVKRVLCRFAGVEGNPGTASVGRALWEIAERELPASGIEQYTQGLMDLGATRCVRVRPDCSRCPLARRCVARASGRTAELPSPRTRRAPPLRETTMLVVRRANHVLLERRPAAGIWGALWSLPEIAVPEPVPGVAEAIGELAKRFGLELRSREELPSFDHAFSHFRLRVFPVLVDVAGGPATHVARDVAQRPGATTWLPLQAVDDAALATPVRKLLIRLRDR